ncbi:MAG: hypothetical protein JKP96_11380 [Oceanicaulis sp.]|nr:hypothetical protein [Oceanicaulis sp.]
MVVMKWWDPCMSQALPDQLPLSVQYVTDAVQSFDAAALSVLSTKSIDLANTVSALPFIG